MFKLSSINRPTLSLFRAVNLFNLGKKKQTLPLGKPPKFLNVLTYEFPTF